MVDDGLLLDYWKEYYEGEIRKRELTILKMKAALEKVVKIGDGVSVGEAIIAAETVLGEK